MSLVSLSRQNNFPVLLLLITNGHVRYKVSHLIKLGIKCVFPRVPSVTELYPTSWILVISKNFHTDWGFGVRSIIHKYLNNYISWNFYIHILIFYIQSHFYLFVEIYNCIWVLIFTVWINIHIHILLYLLNFYSWYLILNLICEKTLPWHINFYSFLLYIL